VPDAPPGAAASPPDRAVAARLAAPPVSHVVACRDCRHWRPLILQAWHDRPPSGECKAIPGGWVVAADDFCGLWAPHPVPPPPTPEVST
jgi:hypothetical protein